jgi:hypothetical protein
MFTCNFLEEFRVIQIFEKNCVNSLALKGYGLFFASNKNGDGMLLMDA